MLAAVLQQAAPMRNYLIHQGTLCIISNILSVLVPHLFYFILFLDPLYMYIYIYVALFVCLSPSIPSFSLPPSFLLFFNFSSIQCFLPPLFFHSFIHFIPFSFTFHICPFPFHNCASLTFETLIPKTFKRKIPHHSSR